MPTRNKIGANKTIFANLDDYCAVRSDPVKNAGKPRWITTTPSDQDFLINSLPGTQLSLAPGIKLAHYHFQSRSFLLTCGLEVGDPPNNITLEDVSGGALTVFLSENYPSPTASSAQVRNILEFADKESDPNYNGFDPEQISRLFPPIQFFSTTQLDDDESFKAFFLLALLSKPALQVRSQQFVTTVVRWLTELRSEAIPYETLCRSVLDPDPSSIFLALYRCLEALYAYSHTESLKAELNLSISWTDLAGTLEEVLDWHPREEPSLAALLKPLDPLKLQRISDCFKETVPDNTSLCNYVANRIYHLRNSLVHYRPFQRQQQRSYPDWDEVNEALAVLIFHIYGKMLS